MSENRYSKLFAAPESLYTTGSPVVMAAGALQKDNQSGKVFVQLKIHNLQSRTIKAATVQIAPFDTVGKPLGEAVEHQYLDLVTERDADFGGKSPIILPDPATHSFAATVSEVIFSDNTIWTAPADADWQPLPKPVALEQALARHAGHSEPAGDDQQLAQQYRLKYGTDCRCNHAVYPDLWRCACGALNQAGEEACHRCGKEAAALANVDLAALAEERDQRVAVEQKQAAERKAAQAAQMAKINKIAMIAVPVLIVLIIAGNLISGSMAKRNAYKLAEQYMEYGHYSEAIKAFRDLGFYKDSAEKAAYAMQGQQMEKALNSIRRGYDEEAYQTLLPIADFENAQEYINSFQYLPVRINDDALEYNEQGKLLKQGDYEYGYNENGDLVREVYNSYQTRRVTDYTLDTQDRPASAVSKHTYRSHRRNDYNITYTYDANGNKASENSEVIVYSERYPYNEIGRTSTSSVYTYDSDGNLTQERQTDKDGIYNIIYENDQYGNPTKVTKQQVDVSGAVLKLVFENIYQYNYDADGNIISCTFNKYNVTEYYWEHVFINDKDLPLTLEQKMPGGNITENGNKSAASN